MTRWIRSAAGIAAFALATHGTSAMATVYAESGDAGGTLADAQAVPFGTDKITGSLSDDYDVDLFKLTYGSSVSFTAFNLKGGTAFGVVQLLSATGTVLSACPDGVWCWNYHANTPITILTANLLPGTYYLKFADTACCAPIGAYSLEFGPATIPLPATLALFGVGLVGLGMTAGRRAR